MAKRSELRTVWVVVGGLGLAIFLIELIVPRSSAVTLAFSAAGLAALVAAIVMYRSLTPRRNKPN